MTAAIETTHAEELKLVQEEVGRPPSPVATPEMLLWQALFAFQAVAVIPDEVGWVLCVQ